VYQILKESSGNIIAIRVRDKTTDDDMSGINQALRDAISNTAKFGFWSRSKGSVTWSPMRCWRSLTSPGTKPGTSNAWRYQQQGVDQILGEGWWVAGSC
jgi:hypothetical protein